MRVSDFFDLRGGGRDAEFAQTLHPGATQPGALCYALDEATLRKANRNPHISAVLTSHECAAQVAPEQGFALVEDPTQAYYDLHNRLVAEDLAPLHREESIHPTASIADTAVLGRRVVIGPGVTIGHGVILHDYTIVGEGTTVEAYAVLGARGMQKTKVGGHFYTVRWAGGVRIGARCEILTGAVVQRPYHAEYTEVADEVRLSVRSNLGHGSQVGARTMIGGSCQVGGNARIGADVWIGQSAVVRDGVRIGDGAEVKMGSAVVSPVLPGDVVSGNFAIAHELSVAAYTKSRRG